MKLIKKISLLMAVLMLLGLGLTACDDFEEEIEITEDPDVEIVGDDWRTWGIIDSFGTLNRSGVAQDVCICVTNTAVEIYFDDESQALLDCAELPTELPEEEYTSLDVSLDDINGDGDSDLVLALTYADSDNLRMTWLYEDQEFVYHDELSNVAAAIDFLPQYVGLWQYENTNLWLIIDEDGTWQCVDENSAVLASGICSCDASAVTLITEAGEESDIMTYNAAEESVWLTDNAGNALVSVQEMNALTCFEMNGIYPNAEVDNDTYVLENGYCCYLVDGSDYVNGTARNEVNILADEVYDGTRQLTFQVVSYLDEKDDPGYTGTYVTVVNNMLFDANTGTWLTDVSSGNDSDMDENHFVYTVTYSGNEYEIEYFVSTVWESDFGDWFKVVTKTYRVYMPEDYTGLMMVSTPTADNYIDSMTLQQLEFTATGSVITEIPVIDFANSLVFSIA